MAIGIVAFSFLAIFALLPAGLNQFRAAMDESVQTQIFQRVVAEAQQTDFDLLKAKPTELRYFDDQGNDLTDENRTNAIYTVEIVVQSTTQLPAGGAGQGSSENLVTLQIRIAHDPGQVAAPFDLKSTLPMTKHVALIARNKHG